jgi:hypothetical protein
VRGGPLGYADLFDLGDLSAAPRLKVRPTEALDTLDDLAGEHPNDSSVQRLAARSRAMRDSPPGADWDAVSRFEVK